MGGWWWRGNVPKELTFKIWIDNVKLERGCSVLCFRRGARGELSIFRIWGGGNCLVSTKIPRVRVTFEIWIDYVEKRVNIVFGERNNVLCPR